MLDFTNTTLVMTDGTGKDFEENENVISKMLNICKFKKVIHFTANTENKSKYSDTIYCKKLSYKDYQKFCIYAIPHHIETDFAFFMQNDGFIANPNLFDSKYFDYDYIGAPWPKGIFFNKHINHPIVGNGGFSLRSKKLIQFCTKMPDLKYNEDSSICVVYGHSLKDVGFKFAPVELAKKFSIEIPLDENHTLENSFGFHGKGYVKPAIDLLKKYCNLIHN